MPKSNESRMVSQMRTATKEPALWTRGKRFSQIHRPYSYSSGYGVGDPPHTQQRFDGGWQGGCVQQGAYNGTISRQGNRDGG